MDQKEKIREVLEGREEVILAYIYGSTVKGCQTRESDMDLGLVLRRDYKADPFYTARLAGEIERKSHPDREVDVRILDGLPPRFLCQVIKGELLLSRDEDERVRFETSVTYSYLDFKPYYDQYDQKRRERLLDET